MSNSATMALLFLKAKKAIEVIIRCGLVLHPTVPIWNNSLQLSQQINCLTNPPFVLYFQRNNRQNDFHGFLLHCIILQGKCAIPGNPININVHGGDGTKVEPFLMFHSKYFTKELKKTKKSFLRKICCITLRGIFVSNARFLPKCNHSDVFECAFARVFVLSSRGSPLYKLVKDVLRYSFPSMNEPF